MFFEMFVSFSERVGWVCCIRGRYELKHYFPHKVLMFLGDYFVFLFAEIVAFHDVIEK